MDSVISSQKKEAGRKASSTGKYSVKEHYLDQFQFVPGVQNLLDGATMKDDDDEYSHIRSASDFSYAADKYAGDHYRIIGDASGEYFGQSEEIIIISFKNSVYRSLFFKWSSSSTSWWIDCRCVYRCIHKEAMYRGSSLEFSRRQGRNSLHKVSDELSE